MPPAPHRSTQDSSSSWSRSLRASSAPTSAASDRLLNSSDEYARPTAASARSFISTRMSTARSSSDSAGASCVGRHRQRGRARQLADLVHAFLRSAEQQHIALAHDVVGTGVELPVQPAADRHDPHAGLGGQREISQRAARRPARPGGSSPVPSSRRRGAGRDARRRGCPASPRPRERCRWRRRRSSRSHRRSTGRPPCPRRPRGCARRASP